MGVSTWFALPVYALSASALVIPNTGPPHDSVSHPNTIEAADHSIAALQTEYEKLEVLKHQLYALHHEVLRQEHEIFALINKDFKSCSGVKCYVQTALRKAPDFFELFKTHFRHRPTNATEGPWECPWTGKKAEAQEDPLSVNTDVVDDAPELSPSPKDGPFHFDDDVFPPPGWRPEHYGPPPPPPHDDHRGPDWHPGHHGPPPPPPYDAEYKPWKENPNAPAPHPHPHKGPHPFHMPHPAPRHKHFKLILATAGFVVAVVILALLFKALKVYLANPRVQADRAARREECRTRREYKRAACQHRLRQCVSRFRPRRRRSDSDTSDYEEKRAMLQRADGADAAQHIMGADINSLRRAHEIVGQLMRAEEGRVHNYPPLQQSQQQEEPTASSSRSVRSLQTMTTLPPYAAPPPRYSQELSRDMEVVDGFRYTPSQSEATGTSSASSFVLDDADLCTESSVVDCRSRLSMDTETVTPSQTRETSRNRKGMEASMDRFRGQFD